jgi:aromatic ring-opening dioxygenase catalytic subunit (LigB family)
VHRFKILNMGIEEENRKRVLFDEMLREAVRLQKKIDESVKFLDENTDKLTEKQEEELDELKNTLQKEILPELEKLNDNIKYYKN